MASKRDIYHTGKIEKYLNRDGLVIGSIRYYVSLYQRAFRPGNVFTQNRACGTPVAQFGYDSVVDVVVIFDQLRTTQPRSGTLVVAYRRCACTSKHEFSVAKRPDGVPVVQVVISRVISCLAITPGLKLSVVTTPPSLRMEQIMTRMAPWKANAESKKNGTWSLAHRNIAWK